MSENHALLQTSTCMRVHILSWRIGADHVGCSIFPNVKHYDIYFPSKKYDSIDSSYVIEISTQLWIEPEIIYSNV